MNKQLILKVNKENTSSRPIGTLNRYKNESSFLIEVFSNPHVFR
jgi:hypothetical protein